MTTVYLPVEYKPAAVKDSKLVRVAEPASDGSDIPLAAYGSVKLCYGFEFIREQHGPTPTDHTMPHEAVKDQNRLVTILYESSFHLSELLGPLSHSWLLRFKDIGLHKFEALDRLFEILYAFLDVV